MGVVVKSKEDIQQVVDRAARENKLMASVLFDDRSSHRKVLDFVTTNLTWFDTLSEPGIYTATFARRWTYEDRGPHYFPTESRMTKEEDRKYPVLRRGEKVSNPSIHFAKLFGISADSFPGILVFSPARLLERRPDGVFVAISLDLFDDYELAESAIAELYAQIDKAFRAEPRTSQEWVEGLRRHLRSKKAKAVGAKVLGEVWTRIEPITRFPEKLVDALAEAVAKTVTMQL